jgi:hypothetical protein
VAFAFIHFGLLVYVIELQDEMTYLSGLLKGNAHEVKGRPGASSLEFLKGGDIDLERLLRPMKHVLIFAGKSLKAIRKLSHFDTGLILYVRR